MQPWHRLRESIRNRSLSLGPGTHSFLKNLSVITIFFSLSKVFSSIAAIIMARYLGVAGFGEAQVVLLVSQLLSLFLLFGFHVGIIRYTARESRPDPVIATAIYLSGLTTIIFTAIFWMLRDTIGEQLGLNETKIYWAISIGLLFSAYTMLSTIYQIFSEFKQRGVIEMSFAALLLPGLAIGHFLVGRNYTSALIAYGFAYFLCLPPMIWRFRRQLSPRNLFSPHTRELVSYSALSLLSNTGYIVTFLIQPLQIQWAYGEDEVGMFRLYSMSSVALATFATTIFYTVFFPKVSASSDKQAIWRRLTAAWLRAAFPIMVLFAIILVITVNLSGGEFPLVWTYVALFAIASTLIAITTTYGQILASQGVRGMRWGLVISLISAITNYSLSALLIPPYGITGALVALIVNYILTLTTAVAVRNNTFKDQNPPAPPPAPAQ